MDRPVHIIEPTLRDANGHCFSLALSLCQGLAGDPSPVHVWTEGSGSALFRDVPAVTAHGHFRRRWRRPQSLLLLRRLLREPGHLILPTARTTDFLLADWAADGPITEPGKLTFFVHWYTPSERKRRFLRKFAATHPGVLVVGPGEAVVSVLRECGFAHAYAVPYPMVDSFAPPDRARPPAFRGLLYSGSARIEKGFPMVVDTVAELLQDADDYPITVHALPPSKGSHEAGIPEAIGRLQALASPRLEVLESAYGLADFQALFPGRISLLPYDPVAYADRVSTVALDAWRSGSPLIAPAGSWMAPMVSKHDAGIVVDSLDPTTLAAAVRTIRADFATYQQNAFRAGDDAMRRHDPSILMDAVKRGPTALTERLGVA